MGFAATDRAKLEVYLTNLGAKPTEVDINIWHERGWSVSRTVPVKSGRSRVADLPSPPAGAFGIRVSHNGGPGDVLAAGAVVDEGVGFSKSLAFGDQVWAQSRRLEAVQVVVDRLPASLDFSADLRLSSYLNLFNASDHVIDLESTITIEGRDYPLPAVSLQPKEARRVSLSRLQDMGFIPENVGVLASFSGEHDGLPGEVLGEFVTVDETADFQFGSPIRSSEGFLFNLTEWRTDGNYDTLLSLLNMTIEVTSVEVKTVHDGVAYLLRLPLLPGIQQSFDFATAVRDGLFRDKNGAALPTEIERGTFSVDNGRVNDGLFMHYQILNSKLATCEPGTGEMAYYVDVYNDTDQYDDNDFVYVKVMGQMSNGGFKDITHSTSKTVSGLPSLSWEYDGMIVPPAVGGSGSLEGSVYLISCGGGSYNYFFAGNEFFVQLSIWDDFNDFGYRQALGRGNWHMYRKCVGHVCSSYSSSLWVDVGDVTPAPGIDAIAGGIKMSFQLAGFPLFNFCYATHELSSILYLEFNPCP